MIYIVIALVLTLLWVVIGVAIYADSHAERYALAVDPDPTYDEIRTLIRWSAAWPWVVSLVLAYHVIHAIWDMLSFRTQDRLRVPVSNVLVYCQFQVVEADRAGLRIRGVL